MNPASPPSRVRRNLWIAFWVLVVFTVTGFFIAPPIVKAQLQKRLSAELGRAVTVGKVRVNPYALSVTLENFDIRLKEGTGSFLGWRRLYVNFDALASLTGDWVLGEIELDGFHAGVIVNRDGSLNFSDILARLTAAAPKAPAKPSRPIRIGSLKVTQAGVDFADQSRAQPFSTIVGPLTFALTEFRTAGARGAPYHFVAVTESGEKLAWSGTLSAEPFRSVGEMSLENIVLPKYSPYYADRMQADFADGKLSMHGQYEINLTEGQRVMKLLGGSLQLRGIKLVERTSREAAVEIPTLDISGVDADALTQKATVGSVSLAGGHLHVRREKDGSVNLLTMLQPAAKDPASPVPAPPAAASPAPAKPPDVAVAEMTLKDFQVEVNDLAAPRPAQLGLTDLQFSLKSFTLDDGATMPLQLSFAWAPQGTVHLDGSVSLKPDLMADLKVDVAGMGILPLSPYLEQFINARVTQGTVSTTGSVQVLLAGGTSAVTFTGGVVMDKFGLVDGAHNEELAGVGALTLTGLKAATSPQLTISVAEVNVTAPYARVLVNQDKSLNLATVAKADSPPASAASPAGATSPAVPAAPPPKIEIGKVAITAGDFSFADRSVEPNVRIALNQFGGTVAGLSSENMAKADVDLKAMVDGVGPVAITGKLDPLGVKKFVDLKIEFKNVDLLPLSPYSGRYAGYELARGKLVVDTKFQLDDTKVDSTNIVTLNQFTFGSPTNSPDATSLPVRLGVALLKDLDGKIVIDVPVQGTVGDPDFHIGKVVWRVIGNLLTKAAVSPFALLGSMFGGGGDELAYQDFAPGSAQLQATEVKKLETMVKALTNRPGLSLGLEGGYDGPADTYAIRQQKLVDVVRRGIWEAKHAADPNIAPPEQLVVTTDEKAAMVKKLYDEKFPAGAEFSAPVAKAPVAAAAPPKPKKGFFGKVVDVVTLKALRGEGKKAEEPVAAATPAAGAAGTVAAGPTPEEMAGRLAETMVVSDNDLQELGQARARQVRDYFITAGKIDPERLFLAKEKTDPATAGKGARVLLALQ